MIFKEKADYKMYLEFLSRYKSEHKFRLFSYCLLPDRLYLLIETGGDATISQIMHDLNSLYTKHFNGKYSRKGPLFESRFRSVLVEKAQHLLQVTRAVHRSAPAPAEHPYSSFHLYIQGDPMGQDPKGMGMAEEIREVTGFLERKDDPQTYARYCLEGDPAEIEEFDKKLTRSSILGSENFTAQARTRIQEKTEAQREAAGGRGGRPSPVFLFLIGGMVIAAAGSAAYLYISKADLERRYELLLKEKEAEFTEKTRFEHVSPIALTDLRGTEWQVETVARRGAAGSAVRDALRFGENEFSSELFGKKGFSPAVFTLTKFGRRTVWQATQKNPEGDKLVWRGDWRGDAMKGSARLEPAFGAAEVFSFFSVKWSYRPAETGKPS